MDTIYVGFKDGDKWTKHFLKKGFAHCSVLLPFQNGWLEIEPTQRILYFSELDDKQALNFTKILRVTIADFKFNRFPIKFCTCVILVEYMLGKSINAITPYRLYKILTGKLKNYFNTQEII